jgi:heme exporter protein A
MSDGDCGVAAVELRHVAKLYGRSAALRATSLRLEAGETLALLGPNGSGKTTLLKIVAGAVTPTVGNGAVFGRDLSRERLALRSEIGFLASETHLYDDLTAAENLRFIVTMAGFRARPDEISRVLVEVDLAAQADVRAREFSSGMKRRLSIARILLLRPRLLLLDEPYNSLDAAGADLIDALVERLTAGGGAVILATHDAERALALADQVAVLDQGTLKYLGSIPGYRMRDAQYVG